MLTRHHQPATTTYDNDNDDNDGYNDDNCNDNSNYDDERKTRRT